nr:unnamed protein product [Spirometra erinaceieuropaei]
MAEHAAAERKDASAQVAAHLTGPNSPFKFDEAEILARSDNRVSRELLEPWVSGPESINKLNDLPVPYSALRLSLGEVVSREDSVRMITLPGVSIGEPNCSRAHTDDEIRQSATRLRRDVGFNPEDVEIMRSILSGGYLLDLSGCALSRLPERRLLLECLCELNLSYNNFECLPEDICALRSLRVLSMKSNPMRVIPNCVQSLSNLKYLDVSFCLLEVLEFGKLTTLSLQGNDLKYVPFGLFELLTDQVLQVNLDYNPMHCLLPLEEIVLFEKAKELPKRLNDRSTNETQAQDAERVMDNTSADYTGQTGRMLRSRIHEHKLAVRRGDALSQVTAQTYEMGHEFNFAVTKIVAHAGNKTGRELIEAWASDENSVNRFIDLAPAYGDLRSQLQSCDVGRRLDLRAL